MAAVVVIVFIALERFDTTLDSSVYSPKTIVNISGKVTNLVFVDKVSETEQSLG